MERKLEQKVNRYASDSPISPFPEMKFEFIPRLTGHSLEDTTLPLISKRA